MSEEQPTVAMRGPQAARVTDDNTWPSGPPEPRTDLARLPRGTPIGRYLIVEPLGEGGMGVVYAAYDPELDRKIAVKVLRIGEGDGTAGRARMQREAQALARLAHPNVIAIHDVGAIGSGVFLAMELAAGGTLRSWQPKRDWRDVVRAYVAAGRGLAAAHEAGLVHRDFKPENVLLGADGRVRVTDFGLVRATAEATTAGLDATLEAPRLEGAIGVAPTIEARALKGELGSPRLSPHSSLTQAGAVMGTPHYMSPEQLAGGEADARSDQFSLCVAAWEGLFGARPFAGEDLVVLRGLIDAGERRAPPADTPVPKRVIDALARGLSAEPQARWPSVTALIDELEAAAAPAAPPAPVRSRVPWIGLTVALAAGAGVAGFATTLGGDARIAACDDAAAPGDALWNDVARGAVRAAFDASRAPWSADAFTAFDRQLGQWRDRWRHAAFATCEAGDATPAVTALRQDCLATARTQVAGVVGELGVSTLDADAVARLADASSLLPDLAACRDVTTLASRTPEPVDQQTQIDGVRTELAARTANLATLDAAGAARSLEAADALVAQARAIGWPPLLAEALFFRGELGELANDVDGARAALFEAINVATASRDDALAANGLRRMAALERQASRLDDAERWILLATAAVERLAAPERPRLEIGYEHALILHRASRLPEARDLLETVRRGYEALAGVDSTQHLAALDALAEVATDEGDYPRAQDYLDRALPVARAALGARHPRTAAILHSAGNVAYWTGDLERASALLTEAVSIRRDSPGYEVELSAAVGALGSVELARGNVAVAKAHLEESLAIVERELGADHPETASAISELGGAYHRAGDHAGALALNRRALAIREQALGPDHPEVGVSLVNIAVESKALGRMDEVEPAYLRALQIFEAGRGNDNPTTGITWLNLAELYRVVGKLDAAAGAYAKSRAILQPIFGPDHIIVAHLFNGEGQLALARGRAAEAVERLERAVAMRAADGSDPAALAESRFALAKALVAAKSPDAARIEQLARDAITDWKQMGESGAAEKAKIEAWLAAW